MDKISIAILGSCVSRDNFNSIFNSGYNELYSCDLYQHQTSILNLLSTKIDYGIQKINSEKISDFDKWYIRIITNDEFLSKIKDIKPDFLIIDFLSDVYYGARYSEGKYITNNMNKLYKTNFYSLIKDFKIINGFSEEYFNIWSVYVHHLFSIIKELTPKTEVIIVKFKFINEYYEDGVKKKISDDDNKIKELNKYIEKYNEYVINKFNTLEIDMTNKNYSLNPNHPWGKFYVHYENEFYNDFLKNLSNCILMKYKKLKQEL